jgi:pimeloyl-ACP methyl ester carboxylesterase
MKKISLIISIILASSQLYCQTPIDFDKDRIIMVSSYHTLKEITYDITVNEDTEQEITDETRRFYFIHGLGGNGGSWSKVTDACTNPNLNIQDFPARKCSTSVPDYTNFTLGSLNYVANNMIDFIRMQNGSDFRDNGMDPSKAILIGHSQGGLVSRTIVHNSLNRTPATYGPDFGGFITVASPLNGAQILNNRSLILDMADNACTKLIEGLTTEKRIVNSIFKFMLGDDYVSAGCEFASQNILPMFFTKYFHQITEDYKTDALWLDILNNDRYDQRYINMPKIAMYGVEPRDQIFWRTVEWMITDPNDVNIGYFGANSDLTFYHNTIAPLHYDLYSKLVSAKQDLQNWKDLEPWIVSGGILTAGALVLAGVGSVWAYYLELDKRRENVEAYEKSVNWFTEVNNEWEVIIGAKSYRAETVSGYNCTSCRYYPTEQSDPIKAPTTPYVKFNVGFTQDYRTCLDFECQNIEPAVSVIYHPVLLENDGVVTRPSASELPYATRAPIRVYPREFEDVIDKGSSHMQIRNDEGIKIHLNKALNGDYGPFFRTEPQYE